MMKLLHYLKQLFLFLLLLMPFLSQGQHVNETFKNEISQAFGGLDKNRVPHGLLLDFAMEFTDVSAYNGQLTGSNFIDLNTYTNLYHTMIHTRF